MARLHPKIVDLAGEFVLVRLTSMRGVNLDIFDFDFDLTWAGLFLSPDEEIYGRYGGRDALSPDSRISLTGLRYAMTQALKAHQSKSQVRNPKSSRDSSFSVRSIPRTLTDKSQRSTIDQYPTAQRRASSSCIHCHQVYDFRRESLQAEGKWTQDEVWVYPLPENVGLSLDVDEGDRVQTIADQSPAYHAGLQTNDRLRRVNGVPIASIADVQYGLHRAGAEGEIPISWLRDGKLMSSRLSVSKGWRKTDISWRWSLRGLEPAPWVQGEDLTPEEKSRLGISKNQLAFYQAAFVSASARQAGIRPNDIILGVDDHHPEMTARQFQAFIRLNYKVGDRVIYNVLREGRRLDLPLTLIGRPAS